jgi:uncharacterized protein YqfB (UPF0267 family)
MKEEAKTNRTWRSRTIWMLFVALALVLGGALTTAGSAPRRVPPTPAAPAAQLNSRGPYIRLTRYTFDPLLGALPHSLPAELTWSHAPPTGMGYYLLQFHGPIQPQWKEDLLAAGVQILDYIPDWAFIVRMDGATRATVASMDAVRWVGLYQPGYRIAPSLASTPPSQDTFTPVEDVDRVQVMVIIFQGEDVAALAEQLRQMGGTVLDVSETHWKGKINVELARSQINAIAHLSGVKWIEPSPEWRLLNDKAADIMDVREVWSTHGLYGAGQTVAVCDTGLDQGSTSPDSLHDDFEDGSGNTRVEHIYNRVLFDGANDVISGHGTHVAGSVLGNGARSGSIPSSHHYPSTAYVGMAPEATLVFQAVEHNFTGFLMGIPSDLNTLFGQVLANGARIHTNSWGSPDAGAYTSFSQDVDEFVWLHPDFTILFAGGNEGIDADGNGVVDLGSMDSPGTAKNCITVGAIENDRPDQAVTYSLAWPQEYPAAPIRSDLIADAPGGIAAFSSRGPVEDGRIKPDVVAPGTFIASAKSQDPSFSGVGWQDINAYYMYMGGTSMATPLVAGTVALVREYYDAIQGIVPSAALIKATLINGATELYPGQYGTGSTQEVPSNRPNHVEGWGRVNVERALFPPPPRAWIYEDESSGLGTGQVAAYTLELIDSSEPLRVTLAWSDYPGSPAASGSLVNDLDLSVSGPGGTVYYPNNAVGSASFDRVNNVVGIDVEDPAPGIYTITVRGYNVPQGPQPYALVASGAISTALAPLVTSVTPSSGTSGSTVHITDLAGSHFQAGATVKLTQIGEPDIHATHVNVVSDSQITCDLDLTGASPGLWKVVVTNPDQQSGYLTDGFTISSAPPPPTVVSISPSSGINTGTVHITDLAGSNFQAGATVKLSLSNHPDIHAVSVNVISATQIACDLDLIGAATGLWDVTVTNPDAQSGTLFSGFAVNGSPTAPTVTGITPSSGLNTGTVHITDLAGSHFQAGATVRLTRIGEPDIHATHVNVVSDSQITCDLDLTGASPGLWNVVVTNPDQQSGYLTNGFAIPGIVYLPIVRKDR